MGVGVEYFETVARHVHASWYCHWREIASSRRSSQ
jgi:hypothetical protein